MVRTICAGVVISRGLSPFVAACSLYLRTELDNDVALFNVRARGVPLSRTTLRGKGLFARVPGEAVCSLARPSPSPTLLPRTCLFLTSSTAVDPLRLFWSFGGDDGGRIDASSFSKALVSALNFIGMGISSSELSLSEYWRACAVEGAVAGTGRGPPRLR